MRFKKLLEDCLFVVLRGIEQAPPIALQQLAVTVPCQSCGSAFQFICSLGVQRFVILFVSLPLRPLE